MLNGSEGGDAVCNECKGGSDFCIIDPNGLDDGEAKICVRDPFQDPDTGEDPCSDEFPESCKELAVYAIFARTVGKGSASAGLCVDITTSGGDTISDCYTGSVVINPKKATDISQQLLTVCVEDQKVGLFDELCTNGDGGLGPCKGEYNNPTDEEYYWAYDNEGNRRAEFRFYDAKVLNQLTGTECFGVTRGGAIC